ncbi:DNA repair protein RecN [Pseudonocardia sp. KRD-184]|uniref:DNA repair protein RecN n=1 Tax=Pseudonocardia oceani TaxID=2792013 RepID=A0ABS6UH77_9PSEU|nr:DNA repair protein RecN [Pseudonocardia oceani]MBW0090325.1 DNA repair protein RecN [Pseudonocardia oceani]MBW0099323.1 DNA repair protein RecN [Pseudonocardia oceani]MBW0111879.1 DNA repair protein RecN [Pseudonocardia oceani]MBW0123347.1 DNA repair protein RecN [Pseudonocardia oceani]MBW0131615.1 DNA repair protein RecN [Pseudonocardia oceani]
MLAEMRIQGLGVIDDATLELDPGLTVLTGETGAGKTMVVTGLSLLGGGRADVSRVQEGAKRAVVEGRFAAGEAALAVADEVGADADEDGTLIAVRTVGADGRSRAHLGGRSVPVGVLARLAEATLAVHGQNDQLRLLRPAEQRALLDRFAGDAVAGPLARYRSVRAEWQKVAVELVERRDGARRMAQEADLLRHGLTEIGSVDPQPGEDSELQAQARRLAAADELREVAVLAQVALVGAEEGDPDAPAALALIGDARHRLAGSGDDELAALDARLGEVLALLGDVGAELTDYLGRLDADPERLAAVLSRQAELKALTRKYAADVDGVLAWAEEARGRLDGLDTSEETLGLLAERRDALAEELAGHAEEVTAARVEAAERLAAGTTAELGGLAMADARLLVDVRPRPAGPDAPDALTVGGLRLTAGTTGVDDVELRLVAHGGATPQPLHKGASGGELSRVMLALEVALAGADPVPTMVFDEVDAGVGGRAAVEIGRRLARLAARHQVIVVTHLPQVAAYADRHLVVDKSVPTGAGSDRARSRVRTLAEGDRIVELARMLAGLDDTDTGRAHAEELLGAARAHREADRAPTAKRGAARKGAVTRTR